MCRRASLPWSTLEQIGDQIPFGVGQISAVEGDVFASVRRRVAVAFGAFVGSWGHPSLRLEPDDSLHSQCTPDCRRAVTQAASTIQLVGNFFQTRLRMLRHDVVQSCDMLSF